MYHLYMLYVKTFNMLYVDYSNGHVVFIINKKSCEATFGQFVLMLLYCIDVAQTVAVENF